MSVIERDLTDEEYDNLYKNIYDAPWTKDLLKKSNEFLENWDKNKDYFVHRSQLALRADSDEKIHLKNAIRYWEKKLNENK